MGVELVLPVVGYKLHRVLHPRAGAWKSAEIAVVLATFPLLFFFSGLFYTDVWSTVFVLLGYLNTVKGRIWIAAVVGYFRVPVEGRMLMGDSSRRYRCYLDRRMCYGWLSSSSTTWYDIRRRRRKNRRWSIRPIFGMSLSRSS